MTNANLTATGINGEAITAKAGKFYTNIRNRETGAFEAKREDGYIFSAYGFDFGFTCKGRTAKTVKVTELSTGYGVGNTQAFDGRLESFTQTAVDTITARTLEILSNESQLNKIREEFALLVAVAKNADKAADKEKRDAAKALKAEKDAYSASVGMPVMKRGAYSIMMTVDGAPTTKTVKGMLFTYKGHKLAFNGVKFGNLTDLNSGLDIGTVCADPKKEPGAFVAALDARVAGLENYISQNADAYAEKVNAFNALVNPVEAAPVIAPTDCKALAADYEKRGYFTGMSAAEIQKEIGVLRAEIKRADKRTYNGKSTRTFNECKIAIAEIILKAREMEETPLKTPTRRAKNIKCSFGYDNGEFSEMKYRVYAKGLNGSAKVYTTDFSRCADEFTGDFMKIAADMIKCGFTPWKMDIDDITVFEGEGISAFWAYLAEYGASVPMDKLPDTDNERVIAPTIDETPDVVLVTAKTKCAPSRGKNTQNRVGLHKRTGKRRYLKLPLALHSIVCYKHTCGNTYISMQGKRRADMSVNAPRAPA